MADEKDDGGPAFPATEEVEGSEGFHPVLHAGMSLRDWFAGNLIQALMTTLMHIPSMSHGPSASAQLGYATISAGPAEIARCAYEVADAMLAERKK